MNELIKDKILGSLLGGAIGDALGYPIEFEKNVKEKEITRYKEKGIISDDTQMTLFTANALIWGETRGVLKGITLNPTEAIYLAYKDWYDTQSGTITNANKITWIKNIPELNANRAPGNTCLSALSSGTKGTIDNPINNSKGCGGIMRVAPIGLYIKNSEMVGKIAAESSAITHGHPLGIIPSYVFATMLYFITYENLNIEDSLNKAMGQYKEKFNLYDKDTNEYFEALINKAVDLSSKNMSDIEAIKNLGEGWVAEEAFAIAIYSCLKYQDNFEDAIVCSINHGGDSDSTGAITGNIIGAYLGYSKIPNYYIEKLELKDIILELANDMSVSVPVSEYLNNDQNWLNKYVYCDKNINSINDNQNLTTENDKITIDKKEYEALKKYKDDSLNYDLFVDFALKLSKGAVIPSSHPNEKNGLFIEIFNEKKCNIEIDGKEYKINDKKTFDKIKKYVTDNLNLLVNWSIRQNKFNLDNNLLEGSNCNIKVKYGNLIINVNGSVKDIGNLCDNFIEEIKEIIINGDMNL